MIETLQRGWNKNLNEIFQSVQTELTVSSPYISDTGAEFLLKNVSKNFKENGVIKFVTDLSPRNIYISDSNKAIITSGNLTAGGIYNNFEYGVFIKEDEKISVIKNDLLNYANLGALINSEEINNYCEVSEEIKKLYKQKEKSVKSEIEIRFKKAIRKANDELIRARLSGGALHSVFERTILYLLQKHGPLPTSTIHNLIEEIHPDLCDNSVDRVIDGVNFGKKWKHAARTAQQHLKKKGLATFENRLWKLT